MTNVDYDICETQAMIYRYAAREGFDMEAFSDKYLRSDFCRRAMDAIYSRFQLADDVECWDFIYPELKSELTKYEDNHMFSPDAAYWIGYIYRQLAFETGMPSAEIQGYLPFKEMCKVYPGGHTVDENVAVEILMEAINKKKAAVSA